MNDVLAADLCRLTVRAPRTQVDLALPGSMPLAELLPVLVGHCAAEPAHQYSDGWVLQRLGQEPFDEDATLDALGIRDGETLYLRPKQAAIPPIDYDDIVDGVSIAIQQRRDQWRPEMTRKLFLATGGCTLFTTWCGLLLDGPVGLRAVLSVTAMLLLIGAAAVWSRAFGNGVVGTLLGVAALPFALLNGVLLSSVVGDRSMDVGQLSGAGMASSGAIGCLAIALAATAVATAAPVFLGAFICSAALGLGGLLVIAFDMARTESAAVLAAAAFLLSVFAPVTAARLVKLRLPQLPTGAEDLQVGIEATPEREIATKAAAADQCASALFLATALIHVSSAVLLAAADDWTARLLLALLSSALLLRSRLLISAVQRSALVFAGGGGLVLLTLATMQGMSALGHMAILFVLMVGAGLQFVASKQLPGKRLLPYWGRAADIIETLLAAAAIPVLLVVLGVYAWVRSLAG